MTANHEPFSSVHQSRERLVGVQGYFFVDEIGDEMLVAVRFEFEHDAVVVSAQEDDSLKILGSAWTCGNSGVVSRNLGTMHPWECAVGKPLLWSWRMINQQGYFDGVQLQFAENVEDVEVQFQLLVIASEIKTRVV